MFLLNYGSLNCHMTSLLPSKRIIVSFQRLQRQLNMVKAHTATPSVLVKPSHQGQDNNNDEDADDLNEAANVVQS